MTAERFGRRFTATWQEQIGRPTSITALNPSIASTAGGETFAVPALYGEHAGEGDASPETLEAIRVARAEGLPSLYAAEGIGFPAAVPVLHRHRGKVLGYAFDIRPDGAGFAVSGWLDDVASEAVLGCAFVSPGLVIEEARIVRSPSGDGLFVTRSTLVELSVTETPARDGTSFVLGHRERVPAGERFGAEGAAQADRLIVDGFPGRLSVF